MIAKMIKIAFTVSFLTTFLSYNAFAASPSFSCSSNLVVSTYNGYQASCDGDFVFTDGAIASDISINLTATGLLNIGENASLSSPFINLYGANIFVGGVLNAPSANIVLSSNSTFVGATRQVNVANNLIMQNKPTTLSNWSNFNIPQASQGAFISTSSNAQLMTTDGANIQLMNDVITPITVADSIINAKIVKPLQGGFIVLQNNNGILFPASSNLQTGAIQAYPVAINMNQLAAQVPESSSYLMLLLGLIGIRQTSKRYALKPHRAA